MELLLLKFPQVISRLYEVMQLLGRAGIKVKLSSLIDKTTVETSPGIHEWRKDCIGADGELSDTKVLALFPAYQNTLNR